MQHLLHTCICVRSETSEECTACMTALKKTQTTRHNAWSTAAMIILNCTTVEGIPRMLRHHYTEIARISHFPKFLKNLTYAHCSVYQAFLLAPPPNWNWNAWVRGYTVCLEVS